jgi:hypothetical protein
MIKILYFGMVSYFLSSQIDIYQAEFSLNSLYYELFKKIKVCLLMQKMRKYLIWALAAGFLILGISAYVQSQPEPKNKRVYQEIQKYSPYYIDKRVGGLNIKSKEDEAFKEKPDNIELFHRLDALNKNWGKDHLKLQNSQLLVLDNNGSTKAVIPLNNQDELDFIHRFYGI